MTKKRISAWLDTKDINSLNQKIKYSGYGGKGKLERFLERIARAKAIAFIEGTETKIKVEVK